MARGFAFIYFVQMKAVMELFSLSVISCKNSLMSLYKCINLVVPQCISLLNNIKRLDKSLTKLMFQYIV